MSDARRKLCLQKASADAAHERFARSTEACRSSKTHCEGDLLLGFCGKVPSKARRTRKSRGSLLCVNDRGLPQFDNAFAKEIFRKKRAQKNAPISTGNGYCSKVKRLCQMSQATDIVAKSSGFVKCLMQNSPKNSPFARSARTTGELLQKKMTTLLQLCAGFFTKVCYDIAR